MTRLFRWSSLPYVACGFVAGVVPVLAVVLGVAATIRHAFSTRNSGVARAADMPWALAAGAFGVSVAVTDGALPAVQASVWFVAAWLAWRSFATLRSLGPVRDRQRALIYGLSLALLFMVAASVARALAAGTDVGGLAAFVVPALAGSASLAHSALAVSGVTAVLARGRPWHVLFALTAASVAIAFSGHLTVLIGVVAIALAIFDLDRRAMVPPVRMMTGIVAGVMVVAGVTGAISLETVARDVARQDSSSNQGMTPPASTIAESRVNPATMSRSVAAHLGWTGAGPDDIDTVSFEEVPIASPAGGKLLVSSAAWRNAWDAFLMRPFVGHGGGSASFAGLDEGAQRDDVGPVPPGLLVDTSLRYGLVGLVGLAALLVALFGHAVRHRDARLVALGVAVLAANAFDASLLGAGVLMPLAALAGWRRHYAVLATSIAFSSIRKALVIAVLALTEALVALFALILASRLHGEWASDVASSATLLALIMLWPILSWRSGMFPGYGLTPAQELRNHATSAFYVATLCVLGWFFVPSLSSVPFMALIATIALAALFQPIGRATAKRFLLGLRLWGRPVVILGASELGRRLARSLERTPLDGLHPVGFFDDDVRLHGARIEGLRVRGSIGDAEGFGARHRIRHAIVALPELDPARVDWLVTGSTHAFRRIQFVPHLAGLPTDDVVATDLDGILALEVRSGLFHPANRVTKRISDIVGSAALLAVTAPLLAVLWLLIRRDSPGGAFHHSARVARDGRSFQCLKFRTMYQDAEERLDAMLASDTAVREEYGRWHKLDDDPRITRIGRFLRRTSLDELPQLWNVIKGEMSLVGPRPYLAREVPDMGRRATVIHHAKPGMTGYWQVTGRSSVTFEERLDMEAHYVRNWSLWWDVILLTQTPVAVVTRRRAVR